MSRHRDSRLLPVGASRAQLTIAVLFAAPAVVYAYIDPGTGSVLVQALIAAIVGALFTIKTWWRRVSVLFAKRTDAAANISNGKRPAD